MRPLALKAARARQARLGQAIGQTGFWLLVVLGSLALLGAIVSLAQGQHATGGALISLALICYLPALWWRLQLRVLPPSGPTLTDRLSADVLARLKPNTPQTPQGVWQALQTHWQANFVLNHLLLTRELVNARLSQDPAELEAALQVAVKIADQNQVQKIELGLVIVGLMATSPACRQLLTQLKAQPGDIEAIGHWLARTLADAPPSSRYGGIGRDWAFGFTPLLNRFGENISQAIMHHGARFDWLMESPGVKAIETAFNNRTRAVAVVGPDGVGKTESIYALAQRLIEGKTGRTLAYHQIIGINATHLLSTARRQGDLEHIMLSLAAEAAHAGHVILFFDDAQLFLTDSVGAFDATQVLLSIIQKRAVPLILAMSPSDFQRLKSHNGSLAALLTPVMLTEPNEADVMRILEDTTLAIEHGHNVLVAYEALHEAYRLSGRYDQDEAYPGRAIKLLQHAAGHAQHGAITRVSVQQAIEQTHGVKAAGAAPAEAEALLHLEDQIHRRMINQTHAVSVVANALRRARAGVTNPRRPLGSFLFMGPTGVGKTELAKAIAATYFGAESNMIRLDMSEYSNEHDVQRLLATGQSETASLLMSVRQQPFSVVLLDELEKAHPNILNLLLQLLDEGQLTDVSGRAASFKDCIIIATSNAGAVEIRERLAKGETLESFASELTDQLINSGQFKPELLNRFDDLVLFRPLSPDELGQVVKLMLAEVNQTLTTQNISVSLTEPAIQFIVEKGNDPRLGARPMRRALQSVVEDTVAKRILSGQAQPGDTIQLDVADLQG